MKKSNCTNLRIVPVQIDYLKGRRQVTIKIADTHIEDWVDKQEIQRYLHMQYLRTRKQIPYSVIGGKILYYLPGIVSLIEQNVFY